MANNPESNSRHLTPNGTKAIGLVAAILVVLGGLYSLNVPTSQRMDNIEQNAADNEDDLREDMRELKTKMEKLNDTITSNVEKGFDRTLLTAHSLSQLIEKFAEVETQFDAAREANRLTAAALERRIEKLETFGDPAHEERIKFLEREIFGKKPSHNSRNQRGLK